MSQPLCIIAGFGPGNGAASCNRFLQAGYRVAILGRDEQRLTEFADKDGDTHAYVCDLADRLMISSVFEQIAADLGAIDVLIYNAGAGLFGGPLEVSLDDFEIAWRVNALGLLAVAQKVAPAMIENGGGALLITGATASLRGGANFAAFAPAKAAQRSLAQSLSRSLGSQGIHVALVIVDGVIDLPRTRARQPDKPDNEYLQPTAIAETFFHLSQQPPSAWTFEIDLRPNTERW